MPTYAELAAEPWWDAEFEPPALAAFNSHLRTHYGHTRSQTGSKGDNRHLRGRHRSINWCLNSIYCTNRAYGTVDSRDRRGNWDALRATDVGITNVTLRTTSARLDAAVRAGQLPELAEWFGTINGTTVVGWYEGRPSSSDSSHLYHLHLGYWTEHTNNAGFFTRLYDVITGDDMATTTEIWAADINPAPDGSHTAGGALWTILNRTGWLNQMSSLLADVATLKAAHMAQDAKLDQILAALASGGVDVREAVANALEAGAAAARGEA